MYRERKLMACRKFAWTLRKWRYWVLQRGSDRYARNRLGWYEDIA